MSTNPRTRPQRSPWWVLVGGGVAGAVGPGPLVLSTLGLFVIPITTDMGWGRTTVTGAYSVAALGMAIGLPIVGYLMDRFALRAILVPCWLGFTICTGLIGVSPPTVAIFLLPYFFLGLFGAGTSITFTKALLSWFDNKRGLAIGLMAGITGLGTSLTPILAGALIGRFGWRTAYLLLALVASVVSLTMIFAFVRVRAERSVRGRLVTETVENDKVVSLALPGLTVKESLRRRHFWMIAISLGLAGMTIVGLQVHLVPMMIDRGLDAGGAALLLSVYGLASLVGRVVGGLILDRIHGPTVGAVVLCAPIAGIFALDAPFARAASAIAFIGVAFGIEGDLLAFFISRYLGMRSFGKLVGIVASGFLVGTAVGPLLLGLGYDKFGTYDPIIPVLGGVLGFSALILLVLGPYTYPAIKGFDNTAAKDELAAAEVLARVAAVEAHEVPAETPPMTRSTETA